MQVQLIERKADGEDAVHRVVRQFASQALASQRGDFRGACRCRRQLSTQGRPPMMTDANITKAE